MESSSSSLISHGKKLRETSISNQISSAIKGKTCPICLSHIAGHRPAIIAVCMHAYCLRCLLRWTNHKRTCPLCNSLFDSYFSTSSPSSRTFQKHRLLPLHPTPPDTPSRRDSRPIAVQRVLRRTRVEINAVNRRSRPVGRRRSFGRLGFVPPEVIKERVLQWRASIYKHGFLAVPFANRSIPELKMPMSVGDRETMLCRIEPWIRRELQAILQDPDPTVIVHLATALYLSSIERKPKVSSCPDSQDDFLSPLRRFLHKWTDMFWHELRCFAESYYTMDTYDTVVEYRKSD